MKTKYLKGSLLLFGLIAVFGLQSCQITNRYESPKVDTSKLYRGDTDQKDTTTIADIPWAEYFKDNYLKAYIQKALDNNYDMLIIQERIKQAEAALGMARAAYFPDLALSAQVNQTRLSNASPTTGLPKDKNVLGYHKEAYSLGLVASWEIDVWGKLNRAKRAKYADMLYSYAGKNLLQSSLIASIANTYYSLIALDENLKVTQDMVVLLEDNLTTMEALKESGMANAAGVEQSRAALHKVKASIPDLKSSIYQLENALCVMMAERPTCIKRGTLTEQNIPATLAYGVPVQLLAKRPDVLQAEFQFRSAFEMTNVAQASFYPSITLSTGMIGFSTMNTLSQFFKPENLIANIIGGLAQPIFARKKLLTQLKVAKAEQKAALYGFEKTVLTAGQEVSDILNTYKNALDKDFDRNTQVNAYKKAAEYTHELLQAGEATYLEVISAQQGLLQAQLDQNSDKLQQLQATSNLYKALGGGVK